jgi:predicted Zn finger-like uncharacterized protein
MILVCENCNAQFVVNAAKLGHEGRKVRCGSCGHSWHQVPPDDMPGMAGADSAFDSGAEAAAESGESTDAGERPGLIARLKDKLPGLPSIKLPFAIPFLKRKGGDDAAVLDDEPAAPVPFPKRRVPGAVRSKGTSGRVAWIMFGLVMVAMPATAILARETIVDAWGPAAKLFDAIGLHVEVPGAGLQLRNVTSERRQVSGITVLVIEGEIVNLSKVPRVIPMLRGGLRDATREELQHWLFSTGNQRLAPQEAIRFKSEFPEPPTESADLTLYFVRG